MTASQISALVEAEFTRIPDPALAAFLRGLLISPRCEDRPWDYGPPESYPCWIVAEHSKSGTGFAYCAQGFGPRSPWGLLWLSGGHPNMGMDCSWYSALEDAFRESFAFEEFRSSSTPAA